MMTESNDVPAAFQAFTEISIIEQLSRNELERQLPDGLKMSQFGVLNHLDRLGGEWSPLRLANAFQVTKGAMTNTLQRLEKRGLISIQSDPNDGRGKLVSLTKLGCETRHVCIKSVGSLLADISNEISDDELAEIIPTLQKLRKFLDERRS